MLGVEFFNNDIIRKYSTVFGNMFNDIYIHRVDATGTKLQVIPVPCQIAGASKFVALDEKNPITTKVQTQLPRMAYELTNIEFARERAVNPIQKNVKVLNSNVMKVQYAEIPYNFDFTLQIYTKTTDDAHQIIGQIIPFFRPSFTPTVIVIPEMDLRFDSMVELTNIDKNDEYQGGVEEPRFINWTLQFRMAAYFFGPISSQGVIKRAIVDLISVPGNGPVTGDEVDKFGRDTRITVQPGLTANGTPTTVLGDSIPVSEINRDDPYALIETIEVFDDGKKYDPVSGTDK
jgi:hypothetical protein